MRNSKPRSLTLLRLLLMTLAMLFITPKAFADLDGSQFHKAYNYQINLSGTNSIKLKFPCGGDNHVFASKKKSVLNFKLPGQSDKTRLMELHSKNGTKDDSSQKGKYMYFWFEFDWSYAYNHTLQLTSGAEQPAYSTTTPRATPSTILVSPYKLHVRRNNSHSTNSYTNIICLY